VLCPLQLSGGPRILQSCSVFLTELDFGGRRELLPYRIVSSGEMADRTREFDWANTSLGPIESWPDELITTVNLLLASRYPMLLWWGPERIQFYNDAYLPSIGHDRHPSALGQRGADCWREIWAQIGPEIDAVIASGNPTWNVDRVVPRIREGRMEEVFWTYSYSPMRDREGRVKGILVVCNETTDQVLSERRLRTLLALDSGVAGARTIDELAGQLVRTLSGSREDVPFAMIYRMENLDAFLVGQTGLEGGVRGMANQLPIREVAASKKSRLVDNFSERVGNVVCEPWPEAIQIAYVQPSGVAFQSQYVLVLGVSPRLPFNGNYESFLQMVCNRICQLLENEAHQQARQLVDAQRARLFETVDQQRELLESIVESAPAGIAVLDHDLRVKWSNPYFSKFLDNEWSSQRLIGLELRRVVPQSEDVLRIIERVRDTHEPFMSSEYEHRGFSRGITYWQWSAVRLATSDVLIVASEVTEQVMARRKLEVVGERLHLAQKAARLGTYYWHLPSETVEWSDEFYEATGFDPAANADWEFYFAQVHPEDRDRVRQEMANLSNQGVTLHVHDHRLKGAEGWERWVSLTGYIHLNAVGEPERIIGTVLDITARKRAETDLEQSKREVQKQWSELEAIYLTAPIGLALFDPVEFRYLRLNSRQAEIVGLPPEQILGKTLTEIAPIEGLREMFDQVAGGNPVINALLEGELPMSPGEHRYWTVNYFPVYDAYGAIQAISAASLEITQQKRAELALIQSEKIAAVGRLASSISHEINNPLEAVTNLLYLLRAENISEQGREHLETAERELARVSQIATHTLRFHRQSTNPSQTKAEDMIEPILALYQGRLGNLGITVEREYRTEEQVLCLEGEIRQVLNNLIGNAIDAMWRGGRLVLRSQFATDWKSGYKGLRITISDTGEGMTEMTKSRLFEAFYTTKGINGTGLGLWISAEIVRKHGGRLRVRSCREEGASGTIFQLFLPLQPVSLVKQKTVRNKSN